MPFHSPGGGPSGLPCRISAFRKGPGPRPSWQQGWQGDTDPTRGCWGHAAGCRAEVSLRSRKRKKPQGPAMSKHAESSDSHGPAAFSTPLARSFLKWSVWPCSIINPRKPAAPKGSRTCLQPSSALHPAGSCENPEILAGDPDIISNRGSRADGSPVGICNLDSGLEPTATEAATSIAFAFLHGSGLRGLMQGPATDQAQPKQLEFSKLS